MLLQITDLSINLLEGLTNIWENTTISNVRKLFIFLLGVGLASVVIALCSSSVYANHREDVLGATTGTLSIPPTSSGPGLVLPDSPLFFVDTLKQEFRLLLAFTPEQKVKAHDAIAGERLAELRIMLVKNNATGIRVALQGVSDNLKAASEDLANAKLTGRNIDSLAEKINVSIKEKQKILSVLELQATGEIKAEVTAAKEGLKVAKVNTEENLPDNILNNEIENDLNLEIEDNTQRASDSAKGLSHAIDVLTGLASQAAKLEQTRRQEALLHAIAVKNEALVKQQEKLVNPGEITQQLLSQAKGEINKVNDGAMGIAEIQRKILELKSSGASMSGSKNLDSSSSLK